MKKCRKAEQRDKEKKNFGCFFVSFHSEHCIGDMAAVKLAYGQQVERGDERGKPSGEKKRIVIHFAHWGQIFWGYPVFERYPEQIFAKAKGLALRVRRYTAR